MYFVNDTSEWNIILVAPLGVAWLRIASAALVFALFRKPWRVFLTSHSRDDAALSRLALFSPR
jgi:threonine/homoserine efflux transporter RhtA